MVRAQILVTDDRQQRCAVGVAKGRITQHNVPWVSVLRHFDRRAKRLFKHISDAVRQRLRGIRVSPRIPLHRV